MGKIEEIKKKAHHFKEYDFYTTVPYEDYLWLVEQAEKVNNPNTEQPIKILANTDDWSVKHDTRNNKLFIGYFEDFHLIDEITVSLHDKEE